MGTSLIMIALLVIFMFLNYWEINILVLICSKSSLTSFPGTGKAPVVLWVDPIQQLSTHVATCLLPSVAQGRGQEEQK